MSPDAPRSAIHALVGALSTVRASADLIAHQTDPPRDGGPGTKPPSSVVRDLRMADGLISRALRALVEWSSTEDDTTP